jgi:hypothetical protein
MSHCRATKHGVLYLISSESTISSYLPNATRSICGSVPTIGFLDQQPSSDHVHDDICQFDNITDVNETPPGTCCSAMLLESSRNLVPPLIVICTCMSITVGVGCYPMTPKDCRPGRSSSGSVEATGTTQNTIREMANDRFPFAIYDMPQPAR